VNVHDAFGDVLAPFFLPCGALWNLFLGFAFGLFFALFVFGHNFSSLSSDGGLSLWTAPTSFQRRFCAVPCACAHWCVGALAADGQVFPVPKPAIGADIDVALDVLRHVAPEIAFDLVVLVDHLADFDDFVVAQSIGLGVEWNSADWRIFFELLRPMP
jgi:hypothetical protein